MAQRIEDLVARHTHLASKGMALKCIVARRMAHLQTSFPLMSDGLLKGWSVQYEIYLSDQRTLRALGDAGNSCKISAKNIVGPVTINVQAKNQVPRGLILNPIHKLEEFCICLLKILQTANSTAHPLQMQQKPPFQTKPPNLPILNGMTFGIWLWHRDLS
jgi:hypothetical protein